MRSGGHERLILKPYYVYDILAIEHASDVANFSELRHLQLTFSGHLGSVKSQILIVAEPKDTVRAQKTRMVDRTPVIGDRQQGVILLCLIHVENVEQGISTTRQNHLAIDRVKRKLQRLVNERVIRKWPADHPH